MKKIILLVVLGTLAASLGAAETGWYGGAGTGVVSVHGGTEMTAVPWQAPAGAQLPGGGTAVAIGNTETTVKVNGQIVDRSFGFGSFQSRLANRPVACFTAAGGYRLNGFFALEAEYEQPETIRLASTVDGFSFRTTEDVENLGVSLLGSYLLSPRCRLFGGVGLGSSWAQASTTFDLSAFPTVAARSSDSRSQVWCALFRAGCEYAFSPQLALRVGWDRPDQSLRAGLNSNPDGAVTLDNFSGTLIWYF